MTDLRTDINNLIDTKEDRTPVTEQGQDRNTDSRPQIVKIPDGKGGYLNLTRTPQDSLGKGGLKLYLPEKAGMHRQWISDEVDGKLQESVNLGFTPVLNDQGIPFQPRRGGTRQDNTKYMMYAMEIPKETLDSLFETDKIKNPAALAQEKQKEWLEGQHNEELKTYNPISNEIKVLNPS